MFNDKVKKNEVGHVSSKTYRRGKGQVFKGKSKTEQSGHVSTKTRIKQMQWAGEVLKQSKMDMFDMEKYDDGEIIVPLVRKPGVQLCDVHRKQKELREKFFKLQKEKKEKSENEYKEKIINEYKRIQDEKQTIEVPKSGSNENDNITAKKTSNVNEKV